MAAGKGERPDTVQRNAAAPSDDARDPIGNDQFRAVVKRLLDTPPMHKTAAPAKRASKARTTKKK